MQFFFDKRAFARQLNQMVRSDLLRLEKRLCLCGHDDVRRLVSYGRYGEMLSAGICRHCGLIYASPYFDAKSLASFYGSDQYRQLYDGVDFMELARARLKEDRGQEILDLVSTVKPSGSSVLEIGCAAGWNLATLQRAGYSVHGYEYTKTLVELGREFGLDIHEGGAPDADGQYDVVIISQVLEHVPDFGIFVHQLKRLMKPDGVLYVAVPDIETYGPGQFQNAHCYYFTRQTLAHYMGRLGLFADELPPILDRVAFHGLFRQKSVDVPSLAGEYERISRIIAPRRLWAQLKNNAHYLFTYVPG
jgi:SAM-dependent methyltransferase